jgi:hypothetical protein
VILTWCFWRRGRKSGRKSLIWRTSESTFIWWIGNLKGSKFNEQGELSCQDLLCDFGFFDWRLSSRRNYIQHFKNSLEFYLILEQYPMKPFNSFLQTYRSSTDQIWKNVFRPNWYILLVIYLR